jgi:hypothetical protein
MLSVCLLPWLASCGSGTVHEDRCVDLDGDGYGEGAACLGLDCDDDDPMCHEGQCCPGACVDLDGDGYGEGTACLGPDCDDDDAMCHEGQCCPGACVDLDGDGYGEGTACLGPDCDDDDAMCHEGQCCPGACVDLDGDGYGEGAACLGPDCDDDDSLCHEGQCCPTVCEDPACLGEMTLVAQGSKPALEVDSGKNPHVVYENAGIHHTFCPGAGQPFSSPEQLSTFGNDARLFIDEDDNLHVVWSRGTGAGATEGWYTNNVGGTWKSPLLACNLAQGGGDRVMMGRVIKIPGQDVAIAVWSVGSSNIVFVKIGSLSSTTPVVQQRAAVANIWVPDLILGADGSGFKTVARAPGGLTVKEFNLSFVQQSSYSAASGRTTGECGSGYRTPDGVGHYTGAPVGEDNTIEAPDHIWYNNDTRIGASQEAIVGAKVTEGDGHLIWSEVCVDLTGRAYLIHDSELALGLFVSYVEAEQLVTQTLDTDYDGVTALTDRYGPMCAPTSTTGVQVVYPVGTDIYHRTVGLL